MERRGRNAGNGWTEEWWTTTRRSRRETTVAVRSAKGRGSRATHSKSGVQRRRQAGLRKNPQPRRAPSRSCPANASGRNPRQETLLGKRGSPARCRAVSRARSVAALCENPLRPKHPSAGCLMRVAGRRKKGQFDRLLPSSQAVSYRGWPERKLARWLGSVQKPSTWLRAAHVASGGVRLHRQIRNLAASPSLPETKAARARANGGLFRQSLV